MNGAKETRTPDPLHAMQVLYQLSYGPVGCERLAGSWSSGLAWRPRRFDRKSLHRSGAHTWRHTASNFPWMATWSASSTIGA